MRRPGHHHLGALRLLIFFNGDEIGKSLKRMHRGALHEENGTAAIFDELLQNFLFVVVLTIFETGETAYTDNVAIRAHHGNGFQEMFALVAVHDDATFGLQLPGALVHVEHYDVHTQIHSCLLGGETGAQRVVEKDEHCRLVTTQTLILITVLLDVKSLFQCLIQRTYVTYVLKYFHMCMPIVYRAKIQKKGELQKKHDVGKFQTLNFFVTLRPVWVEDCLYWHYCWRS